MKNISKASLGYIREEMMILRKMGHLGENQGHAQVLSPFELIPKTQIQNEGKRSPEKERRQNPGYHKERHKTRDKHI